MSKKIRIIDGDSLVRVNPDTGQKYIRIKGEEQINIINIKEVKIYGNIKGIKEKIELIMDKKIFFEWVAKIKQDARNGR